MEQNEMTQNQEQPIVAAPQASQPVIQNGQTTLNLADPINRVVAYIIDSIIMMIGVAVIIFPLGLALGLTTGLAANTYRDYDSLNFFTSFGGGAISIIGGFLALIIEFLYFVILPSKLYPGQTLGKKALNVQIVQENGSQANMEVMLKRYGVCLVFGFLGLIPFVGILVGCASFIVLIINLIMLLTDAKRQTLFDKIAGTVVISN